MKKPVFNEAQLEMLNIMADVRTYCLFSAGRTAFASLASLCSRNRLNCSNRSIRDIGCCCQNATEAFFCSVTRR